PSSLNLLPFCLFSNLSGVNTGLIIQLLYPEQVFDLKAGTFSSSLNFRPFPESLIKVIPEWCPPEFPPADNVLTIGVFDSLSVVLKSSSLKGNTFGLLLPSRCPIRYIRSLFWGKNHDVLSNCHSS